MKAGQVSRRRGSLARYVVRVFFWQIDVFLGHILSQTSGDMGKKRKKSQGGGHLFSILQFNYNSVQVV